MNILILGGGGREHALAWAISQNPVCDELFAAPGNAGMAEVAQCIALDPCDAADVVAFCDAESIDLVVIGPEAPLAAGVSDRLREAGILTFGPSQAAAQLEVSKTFTKEVCDAANVPTAAWAHFDALEPAKAYVTEKGAPIVVKADGLAAGKGVTVAMNVDEAHAALEDMFGGAYGAAGAEVVIEEFMTGEEASLFVLTDGEAILPLASAQDHKRAYDGDQGPNTGGMGAYSPAPVMTDAVMSRAIEEIIAPTLAELRRRGTPYQGVLYAGLMIENGRGRLVEYNARFGDPEAQVLAMRLGAQFLDAIIAVARGEVADMRLNWAPDHAITVVMAAKGYPGSYAKGAPIGGLAALEGDPMVKVFHAGTATHDGQIVSNGGRVLNVTARGNTLAEARTRAYAAVGQINWDGAMFRTDIGWRAL
ncbi:phosphoribosylamine--glycine ligase [Rubricella aquisinus]|uniref:Phosphoribosylamine--glycine ligase n=1 Tax=Rubricella aquisinus TaxID=2028108 RepID=A0A840WM86_9RHOB|nr:phosphoribosylamine--glycine ligase [Rubricella aquisinus]MBB5516198.1 phosphoribosylamine--glycine ligase [Rubricella aquisinus]